ncbi:MAG: triose-phosphate isomerase [Patescibacteria group bacterium]
MDKIIIANWKANPVTLEEANDLLDFYVEEISKYQNIQLVICPPFVYLEEVAKKITNLKFKISNLFIGAQDVFWEKSGPYTGEISTDMLKNFGVTHVLVGHSDRRYPPVGGGESDEVINRKIEAVLNADITPILLVGERSRDDDRRVVLEQQLSDGLAGLVAEQVSKALITYEPVWAISTAPDAESDNPTNAIEAVKIIQEFIFKTYNLKPITCLYGGSVNQSNVADFLKHQEVCGAVIGGASLRKEEFREVLRIVSTLD